MADENLQKLFQSTLITGADGMVGSYVDFGIRLTHKQLDITDEKAVFETIHRHKPKAIIHLAAATDLKRCQNDPDYAYRVNSIATYYIALAAREVRAKLVYVSTNSVFDGSKSGPYQISDVANPKNAYGHSKYLGELAVKGVLEDFAIVRTCWIFGGGRGKDKKFVGKIMEKIEQGTPEIRASKDNIGSPTYGKDLVWGIRNILSDNMRGSFHLVNSNVCSRAEEAAEIVKTNSAKVKINPVPATEFGLAAECLNESLDAHPIILRPWQDALKEYLKTEW